MPKAPPMRQPRPESETQQTAILLAASREFVSRGLHGARLEDIASQAGVTRAMIYYYFQSREGLYVATLEAAYRAIRRAEQGLRLDADPVKALQELVRFRVFYYAENPEFVGLVNIENQHGARLLLQSSAVNSGGLALARTAEVLARGKAQGVFRAHISALDLHRSMVSLGFFNAANRHTFGHIFSNQQTEAEHLEAVCALATEVVLRFACTAPDAIMTVPIGACHTGSTPD
jgi:AcrR family transcriptional regulator